MLSGSQASCATCHAVAFFAMLLFANQVHTLCAESVRAPCLRAFCVIKMPGTDLSSAWTLPLCRLSARVAELRCCVAVDRRAMSAAIVQRMRAR